jgi:pimeloyl-ACP methyl ester carboxylesterase
VDQIRQAPNAHASLLGQNDPSAILAVGLGLFDMIADKNPRARMLIVNDAGHFHYREHPEEFVRNVINFATGW